MTVQKPAPRRVFLFGRQHYELTRDSWDMLALGVSEEFDDLAGAEIEIRQPATRPTEDRGS
jgi:hypothetical protein